MAPFNADFYSTSATVIPVLFVALMFPGGILHRYSVWTKKWRSRQAIPALRAKRTTRLMMVNRGYTVLDLPVSIVLLIASVGEICALIALAHRSATHLEHTIVFWSVMVLPVIAAVSVSASISQAWVTDPDFGAAAEDTTDAAGSSKAADG